MKQEVNHSPGGRRRRENRHRQIARVLRGRAGLNDDSTKTTKRQAGVTGQKRSKAWFQSGNAVTVIVVCLVSLVSLGLMGCENERKIPRGVVSGGISDTAGNRISNAIVTSRRSLYTAASGKDGRYAFTSLDTGSQRLTVTRDGFRTASLTMTIEEGQVYDNVNFCLEPLDDRISCAIFKRELDTVTFDVFPAEPMKCTFVYQGEHLPQIRTEPTGLGTDHRFVIKPPVPGIVYRFFVEGVTADARRYNTVIATFTTLPAGDMPGAPPVPTAPAVVQTSAGPKITWSYEGLDPLKGFRIWRGETDAPLSLWRTENEVFSAERACVDEQPNPGVRTRYAIESVDLDGNGSPLTAEVTIVPAGLLKESVTWLKAWSPIDLTGDITVPELRSLTIEPGVIVRVATEDLSRSGIHPLLCELVVDGRLIVAASGTEPVRFISAASLPGHEDWAGIRLRTQTGQPSGSEIANLEVVNARTGLAVTDGPLQLAGFGARMCETGLHIEGASGTVLSLLDFNDCTTGFMAEGTSNLTVKNLNARGGGTGAHLRGNRNAFIAGLDVRAVADTALIVDDNASPTVRGALLDSARLGLSVRSASADLQFLTIDAPNGVYVDGADQPLMKNNIIVNRRAQSTGIGIEERTSGRSYVYNNIYGFKYETSGCDQTGAPVLNIDPLFAGSASGEYDYHLRGDSLLLTSSDAGGQMGAYGWVDPDALSAE